MNAGATSVKSRYDGTLLCEPLFVGLTDLLPRGDFVLYGRHLHDSLRHLFVDVVIDCLTKLMVECVAQIDEIRRCGMRFEPVDLMDDPIYQIIYIHCVPPFLLLLSR